MFEPRLQESLKHTPQKLPTDLGKMIQNSIIEKYTFFNDKDVLVHGAIYPEEILLMVGYKEKNSLRQLNFECSIQYNPDNNDNIINKFHASADAIDCMIHEYIDAKGDIEMPIDWTEFQFDDEKIHLKTSKINTELEKMTEDFLKEKGIDIGDTNLNTTDQNFEEIKSSNLH